MASSRHDKTLSLKLFVEKTSKKFVFAEAGNEFVEFISQIMSSPLSTVAKLLNIEATVGSEADIVRKPDDASSSSSPKGCVKGAVSYMVMDNMEVKPMSISLIKPLLARYFHGFDALEEKTFQVGPQEAFAILKASFETNTVLTTVFLEEKIESSKLFPSSACLRMLYLLLGLMVVVCLAAEIIEKYAKISKKMK